MSVHAMGQGRKQEWNVASSVQLEYLGWTIPHIIQSSGEGYPFVMKYVQCDLGASSTWAVGAAVGWYVGGGTANQTLDRIATSDFSDSTASFFAGIALSALTDGQFGWIQIEGRNAVAILNSTLTTTELGAVWSGDNDFSDAANTDLTGPHLLLDTDPAGTAIVVGNALIRAA